MPQDLQQLASYMRQSYTDATQWWEFTGSPALQDAALPEDLLDDAITQTSGVNAADGAADSEAAP